MFYLIVSCLLIKSQSHVPRTIFLIGTRIYTSGVLPFYLRPKSLFCTLVEPPNKRIGCPSTLVTTKEIVPRCTLRQNALSPCLLFNIHSTQIYVLLHIHIFAPKDLTFSFLHSSIGYHDGWNRSSGSSETPKGNYGNVAGR